jgi:acyl carrier protein
MQATCELYETVKAEVLRILDSAWHASNVVVPSTSLMDDLGFDSLKLIDLTLALEAALQVDEFPMQDWADEEAEKSGGRFTLASLVEACARAMAKRDSHGGVRVAQH